MKVTKNTSIHAMRDELLEDDREEIKYYAEPVIESTINIDLYDVELEVEPDGSIYCKDDDYSWAMDPSSEDGDWYDQDLNIRLLSYEDVGNYCIDLIEKDIPAKPGIWAVDGSVTLVCNIIDLQSHTEYNKMYEEYNTHYLTDDVVVEVDLEKSMAENVDVDFIGWQEDY